VDPRDKAVKRMVAPAAPDEGGAKKGTGSGGRAVTYDIKGTIYEFRNEELALPIDPAGEQKIDAKGRLQGGECGLHAARWIATDR
jgi:hypothetical protein